MFARYTVLLDAPDESDAKFSENEEVTEDFQDSLDVIIADFRQKHPDWKVSVQDS
jgi:hypothetical protein